MAQRSDTASSREQSATTTSTGNPDYFSNQRDYTDHLFAGALGTPTKDDVDFSAYVLSHPTQTYYPRQPSESESLYRTAEDAGEKLSPTQAQSQASAESYGPKDQEAEDTGIPNPTDKPPVVAQQQPDQSATKNQPADYPEPDPLVAKLPADQPAIVPDNQPAKKFDWPELRPDASDVLPLATDPAETKQPETWDQYIKDYVAVPEKGGYTADQYKEAWEAAAKSGKPVVLVLDSAKNGLLLQATANGVQEGNAIYIYADTSKLDPSSPLGQYAQRVLNDSTNLESPNHAAIVAFNVHRNDDGTMYGESASYLDSIHSDDWDVPIHTLEASKPPIHDNDDQSGFLDVSSPELLYGGRQSGFYLL
ncbi:MAG TPA: hypothetical protein V6C69_03370 [Trichormus sp.]|jgi:hypothetical protein